MFKSRRIAKILASTALLLGAGSVFPQSASAADGDINVAHWAGPNIDAAAGFRSYGDELGACDERADGYGAWAGLYKNVSNGRGDFIKSAYAGGDGNCGTNTKNVAEGTVVWIKICLRKGGVNYDCKWSDYGYA